MTFSKIVSGADVTLISQQGGIGDVNGSGLQLNARGVVSATAAGDIHLEQTDGDLRLVRAHSTSGDVTVSVRQGQLVNAAENQEIDEERVKELADIWDEWLRDEDLSRTEARTVVPFEQRVNRAYEEYWRLREYGSATDDGFVLDADGIELYRDRAQAAADAEADGTAPPVDDAYIIAFANELYEEQVSLFNEVYDGDWAALDDFQAYNDEYSYKVTAAQYEALTYGANWTRAQLELRVNQNALLPVSNTQIYIQEPNIRGVDVTIKANDANSGGIGSEDAPLSIDLTNITADGEIVLTDQQKAALAAASLPGDVVIVYENGQPVQINLRQMRAVYVNASGDVVLGSGGDIFVRGDGNLNLRSVSAGGDVVLASNESITNRADAGTAAVDVDGNLVLEAGRGSIGTEDNPLTISVSGGGYLSTARANDSLYIKAVHNGDNGDLRFSGIYAGNTVHLMAPHGSIIGGVDGAAGARINAGTLKLSAAGDVRGMNPETSLLIRIGSTGTLSGAIGGSARLAAPEQTLVVSDLTTDGGLDLRAASLRFDGIVGSGQGGFGSMHIAATGHLSEPDAIVMVPDALLRLGGGRLTMTATRSACWPERTAPWRASSPTAPTTSPSKPAPTWSSASSRRPGKWPCGPARRWRTGPVRVRLRSSRADASPALRSCGRKAGAPRISRATTRCWRSRRRIRAWATSYSPTSPSG